MVLESFLTSFKQFQFLNQTDRSARAIAFGSMDNFADLKKLNAFQNILCFSKIAFSAIKWALYEEMRACFRKKQHICLNFVKLGDENRNI